MWGLVFVAFWHQARQLSPATGDSHLKRTWLVLAGSFRNLFRQPTLLVLLLLLLVPALSGLWSADSAYWLERTRVRLPFLVLPWVFANLPPLNGRQLRLVLYILVWVLVLLCIGIGINFFLHFEAIMQAMYQGQPMPVPRNHIRFSLILATAILAGARLWYEGFVWRYPWERKVLAAVVVFLFAFLHFLSVRSGLAAFYLMAGFALVWFVWQTRRWKAGLLILFLLVLAPWIAMQTMPSLAQKVGYTLYDWKQYRSGSGENYSDSERLVSLKTGWYIWQESPWLGAGAGDLRQETARVVEQHFPGYAKTPKLPHNQFLYILAGTGLLGFGLSMLAFAFPLFARGRRYHMMFYAFQVMAFASFLVEYTIETAMGVAWYLFYSLWFFLLPATGPKERRKGREV